MMTLVLMIISELAITSHSLHHFITKRKKEDSYKINT